MQVQPVNLCHRAEFSPRGNLHQSSAFRRFLIEIVLYTECATRLPEPGSQEIAVGNRLRIIRTCIEARIRLRLHSHAQPQIIHSP